MSGGDNGSADGFMILLSGEGFFVGKQVYDNHIVIGLRDGIDNIMFCCMF